MTDRNLTWLLIKNFWKPDSRYREFAAFIVESGVDFERFWKCDLIAGVFWLTALSSLSVAAVVSVLWFFGYIDQ